MALAVLPQLSLALPAVAALHTQDDPMAAYVIMIKRDGTVTAIATNAQAPADRSLELWSLPEGATVPVSLGVLPTMGRVVMKAAASPGTLLLVSAEPVGGSPSGMLTGPVLYRGKLIRG